MKCRAWWMAHASNLGTREAEAGGSARFQSIQGYEVRRYLKKNKVLEARVSLVCEWSEEAGRG